MKLEYIWNKALKKIRGVATVNSSIHPTSKAEAGSQVVNSVMGKYSFCGYDCKIINCTIGAYTSIADGVIIGGAMHPIEWVSTSPVFYNGKDSVKKKFSTFNRPLDKSTFIGNDVWIGDRAIIKAGIKISDGVVIGMGSVVTKDIAPYEIWAGNPARFVRKRFDDEIISKLVESKWYDRDEVSISALAEYIRNPKEFIKKI